MLEVLWIFLQVIRTMKGTIIKALSGFYYVDTGEEIYACRARGIFKNQGIKPYVGDEVDMEVTHEQDKEGFITAINERKNSFIRPPIANVQQFAVIASAARPARGWSCTAASSPAGRGVPRR